MGLLAAKTSSMVDHELPAKSGKYYRLVDVIRGISILLVLIRHFQLSYRLTDGFFGDILPGWFLTPLTGNGNYGVVMFFVISGFLITSRTLERFGELKNIEFRNFYVFRFSRIAPNITLMVSVVVLLGLLGIKIFENDPNGPSLFITVASIATFTHNLLMEKFGYFNYCLNILWSLSVEEVFYLFFPMACLFFRRKKWIVAFWVLFVFISPIYRFAHRNDPTDIYGLYDYLACFDGIAIGCIVANAKKSFVTTGKSSYLIPVFSIGAAGVYFYGSIWSNVTFGVSAISLLIGLILLVMPLSPKGEKVAPHFRLIRAFGKYSYELYLFHVVLLAFLKMRVGKAEMSYYGKPLWFLSYLGISFFVSAMVSHFYAEPLNKKLRLTFSQ